MHYVTGNTTYQDWAWEIFQSIQKNCRVQHRGKVWYGSYPDVRYQDRQPLDSTESFFYAELLKYFYLLFDGHAAAQLHQHFVFNTEAHPLPIMK